MKCPKCNSHNTKRPSVISVRWRLGTEVCLDCDYQGDWIDFSEGISPEELSWIHSVADPILAPIKKDFDELAARIVDLESN
jgi:hypothetical protein